MTLAYFEFSTVSHAALANIETAYKVVPPKPRFLLYPTTETAADGGEVARGLSQAIWD